MILKYSKFTVWTAFSFILIVIFCLLANWKKNYEVTVDWQNVRVFISDWTWPCYLQDAVYFTSRGDSTDQEYFYLSPTTGTITLRKSLQDSLRNQFSFTVQALDNRPQGVQRVAEASVTINILRDSGPPRFVNIPYITSIPITTAINSSVYRVQAVDSDLKVGHIFCNSSFKSMFGCQIRCTYVEERQPTY